MQRYPQYKYVIEKIDETSHWIYISDCESGWKEAIRFREFDGPIELLKRIQEDNSWHIISDEDKVVFAEDPLHLYFEWDDLFGFTIGLDNWSNINQAISFLSKYMVTDK